MENQFLAVIKQVCVFMICAQMILHFRPSESYTKYIKLLISIMVLVQLALPVMGFFGICDEKMLSDKTGYYASFITESLREADITATQAEALLNQMTMEEVKTRLNNIETEETGMEIQIDRIEVGSHE